MTDKCREAFETAFPLADLRKDGRGRYTEPDTARLHVGFFKGFNYRLNVSRNSPFRDTLERSICATVDDYDETLDTLAAAYNQLSNRLRELENINVILEGENERLRGALVGLVDYCKSRHRHCKEIEVAKQALEETNKE